MVCDCTKMAVRGGKENKQWASRGTQARRIFPPCDPIPAAARPASRWMGSAMASQSTEPSYVYGWNVLYAFSASGPRCLYPNTRSTQWWRCCDTNSHSRAARWTATNRRGQPAAQAGSSTSVTGVPSCSLPGHAQRCHTPQAVPGRRGGAPLLGGRPQFGATCY